MGEDLRAFTNFADVEQWAEQHGVWRLRQAIHCNSFDPSSLLLAQIWLQRFDSNVSLALRQREVSLAPPTLRGFPVS